MRNGVIPLVELQFFAFAAVRRRSSRRRRAVPPPPPSVDKTVSFGGARRPSSQRAPL